MVFLCQLLSSRCVCVVTRLASSSFRIFLVHLSSSHPSKEEEAFCLLFNGITWHSGMRHAIKSTMQSQRQAVIDCNHRLSFWASFHWSMRTSGSHCVVYFGRVRQLVIGYTVCSRATSQKFLFSESWFSSKPLSSWAFGSMLASLYVPRYQCVCLLCLPWLVLSFPPPTSHSHTERKERGRERDSHHTQTHAVPGAALLFAPTTRVLLQFVQNLLSLDRIPLCVWTLVPYINYWVIGKGISSWTEIDDLLFTGDVRLWVASRC